MRVHKVFSSIQGEGPHIGHKATFVRFSGCNLSCSFCDTKHDTYEDLGPVDIVNKVTDKRVILTGGEPLIQDRDEMAILVRLLLAADHQIDIETNGTQPLIFQNSLYFANKKITYVASPKYVGNIKELDDILSVGGFLKFVIGPGAWDINLVVLFCKGLHLNFNPVYLMAQDGDISCEMELVKFIIANNFDFPLILLPRLQNLWSVE